MSSTSESTAKSSATAAAIAIATATATATTETKSSATATTTTTVKEESDKWQILNSDGDSDEESNDEPVRAPKEITWKEIERNRERDKRRANWANGDDDDNDSYQGRETFGDWREYYDHSRRDY